MDAKQKYMLSETPDMTVEQIDLVCDLAEALFKALPDPVRLTEEQIENLSEEDARHVLRAVRRACVTQLLMQEYHEHELDDCGDYLYAASENWFKLFNNVWVNDFTGWVDEVKKFLTDFEAYPEGGSDGEVRFAILPGDEDGGGLETRIRQHFGE